MTETRTLSITYVSETGTCVNLLEELSQLLKEHGFRLEAISDHKTQPIPYESLPRGLSD